MVQMVEESDLFLRCMDRAVIEEAGNVGIPVVEKNSGFLDWNW